MQYQLIGKNDYMNEPIRTILHNRDIEDIDSFLNVSIKDTHSYKLLDNIDKAVDCLLSHLKNESKIYIKIDGDCDGYTSAAVLFNYIEYICPDVNLIWEAPTGKEHGIIMNNIPEDVNLVIIPDAGSNQFKEHKALKEKGIDCIVLDHHKAKKSKNAIVVNNQTCDYPNKNLSGVGIVYKFCKALDDKLNIKYADNFLDLVALGNIADVMDLRNLETRYYALKGLENIENPFFKALLKKQEYSTKGEVNIITISFYIAPLINACTRFGSYEEKRNMFLAFIGSNDTLPYKKRGATEEIQQPITEAMARICYNIKQRQNRERDKNLAAIEERIEEKNLLDNKVLIVDVTEQLDPNLTGLVATQLANKYKRPALLLRYNKDKEFFGGSARGYEKGFIKDIRQFLTDSNKFIYAQGHPNACGIGVTAENIVEANEMFNEQLKDVEFEDIYNVDFVIPAKNLTKEFVVDINRYNDLWGGGVDVPTIVFTGLVVIADDIEILGKNQNTIKFKYKDIEFIKYNTTEEETTNIKTTAKTIEVDVIGRCNMNEWKGKMTPQVIVNDFEVRKTKKFVF